MSQYWIQFNNKVKQLRLTREDLEVRWTIPGSGFVDKVKGLFGGGQKMSGKYTVGIVLNQSIDPNGPYSRVLLFVQQSMANDIPRGYDEFIIDDKFLWGQYTDNHGTKEPRFLVLHDKNDKSRVPRDTDFMKAVLNMGNGDWHQRREVKDIQQIVYNWTGAGVSSWLRDSGTVAGGLSAIVGGNPLSSFKK